MKLQVWLVKCKGRKVTVDNLNTKLVMLEKSLVQLQRCLKDVSNRVDAANILNRQMDKKLKDFDQVVLNLKAKVDSLSQELDDSQQNCRNVHILAVLHQEQLQRVHRPSGRGATGEHNADRSIRLRSKSYNPQFNSSNILVCNSIQQ